MAKLMEKHPDLFEEAKAFEKGDGNNVVGEKFYWMGQGQPLNTLEDPEVQQRIIENHQKKVTRFKNKKRRNVLLDNSEGFCEFTDLDEIYDEAEGGGACVTCYK